MRTPQILIAALLALLLGGVARAERVDRDAASLRAEATNVFVATVKESSSAPEREGDWQYDRVVLRATVDSIEKGPALVPGESVQVRAWTRSWQGGGDPPTASYGVRGIPKPGERVRIYATRRVDGSFDVVEPNGFAPANGPSEIDVAFTGSGGLELRGTLQLPAADVAGAKFPAVLLLPGSGPTDRNGNQKPAFVTDLLKQIAARLADEGVASLRFDKRACAGYAAAWPKEPAAMSEFFSYPHFIADATAAFRRLRAEPQIDPSRCALMGHSEGGLFVLQVASDLAGSPEQPAATALLATAGRTLDRLIREQVAFNLRAQNLAPAAMNDLLLHVDRGIAMVKAEKRVPDDMPAGLRPLFNPTAVDLLQAYFTVDPTGLATAVRGPVLVVNGDNDVQVSAELDAKALFGVLDHREPKQPATLVIVEGASHNLKETTSTADPGMKGPVAPKALEAITAWARGLRAEPRS